MASASPSRRGELGGVSEDCRGMGDVFCAALPEEEKGAVMEAEGTGGDLSF